MTHNLVGLDERKEKVPEEASNWSHQEGENPSQFAPTDEEETRKGGQVGHIRRSAIDPLKYFPPFICFHYLKLFIFHLKLFSI